jgi:hypothetical protein
MVRDSFTVVILCTSVFRQFGANPAWRLLPVGTCLSLRFAGDPVGAGRLGHLESSERSIKKWLKKLPRKL